MKKGIFVVIPNYNGAQRLSASIDSILAQSHKDFILIVVDNGSVDDSRTIIESYAARDDRIRGIFQEANYGFTGGVNPGMRLAIKEGAEFVASFNNDAVADKDWLKHLAAFMKAHPGCGIATCSMLHTDRQTFDSTGEEFSIWGLPYPRGRNEPVTKKYNADIDIFGASGGASMYRVSMLAKIGVFDQDFFAYYEDMDISFRAQLAGWKVNYVPSSTVYHEQGKTSEKMSSGFTTYQFMKNTPMVIIKNVPGRLFWRVAPRFWLAYIIFFGSAISHGKGGAALKGWLMSCWLLPKKLIQRRRIQKSRVVSNDYIWNLFVHDLPPNAHKLRTLRKSWHGISRRRKGIDH